LEIMAEIIRLRGSPHEQTQSLLPWYVNNTLEADEAAAVESHLESCGECRSELEAERMLALRVASAPLDVAHGWALLDRTLPERKVPASLPLPLHRRRISVGWAAAAQAAAAVAIVFAAVALDRPAPQATYHALGSASAAGTGNAIILFAPGTSEREMRGLVDGADARIVDGPTASGAYVLRVARAREAALAQLRQSQRITLAEPIDAPGGS
jgi:hypothetical protein